MSTAVEAKADPEVPVFPPLNAHDRCDGTYNSQALVRMVRQISGKSRYQDILLSAHYFNQGEAKLLGEGWSVYEDIREAVLNPPQTAYDTSEH